MALTHVCGAECRISGVSATVGALSHVLLVSGDAYDTLILSESGLVAYLPMHETTGSTVEDLAGAHDGTLSGGTALGGPGIPVGGRSVRFTRASDGIVTLAGTFALGDGPWTYECWIQRASDPAGFEGLISQNATGTPGLGINDTTDFGNEAISGFSTNSGWAVDTDPHEVGTNDGFHHIVLTKDGSDVWKLYLDGVDRTRAAAGTMPSTGSDSAPVILGDWAAGGGGNDFFDGWMTRVAIYSAVLSPTQVADHHELGSTSAPPTVEPSSAVVRSGTHAWRMTADGTNLVTFQTTDAVQYGLFYFYLPVLPPAADSDIVVISAAAYDTYFRISASGTLQVSVGDGFVDSTKAISAGVWYGIEYESDMTSEHTVRWRLHDPTTGWTDQPPQTNAEGASTHESVGLGFVTPSDPGYVIYVDDIVIGQSDTPGEDYGDSGRGGEVVRLLPNRDGQHSAFAVGDFEYDAVVDIANNAADTYTYVDDGDMTSTTDFLAQAVGGAGKYVRHGFQSLSSGQIRAVAVVASVREATTGTSVQHMRVTSDGASFVPVFGDWAGSGLQTAPTPSFVGRTLMERPGGGSWSRAAIGTTYTDWGNSEDASPRPYIDALSLEVAVQDDHGYADMILAEPALRAFWRLDETSGTVATDHGADQRHGSIVGSPTLGVAGPFGADPSTAMTFNGVDQYVTVPHATTFDIGTADFTIEMWLKTPTWPSDLTYLVAHRGNGNVSEWEARMDSGNMLSSRVGLINVKSATPGSRPTDWLHVVLSADRDGNGQWYVNGVADGAPTSIAAESGRSISGTFPVYIARRGLGNYFAGTLKDVALYVGEAFSATKVAEHYDAAVSSARAVTDAARADDIVVRVVTLARTVSDGLAIANTTIASSGAAGSVTEALQLEDSATMAIVGFRPSVGTARTRTTSQAASRASVY